MASRPTGPCRSSSIHDSGFYVQGAFYPMPKKLELYGATSQIFGDTSAGFSTSSEYIGGGNFYPFDTRNHRLNVQVQKVNRSPVGSTFGYYVGGQTRHDVLDGVLGVLLKTRESLDDDLTLPAFVDAR